LRRGESDSIGEAAVSLYRTRVERSSGVLARRKALQKSMGGVWPREACNRSLLTEHRFTWTGPSAQRRTGARRKESTGNLLRVKVRRAPNRDGKVAGSAKGECSFSGCWQQGPERHRGARHPSMEGIPGCGGPSFFHETEGDVA
jgi:hypothetical protein